MKVTTKSSASFFGLFIIIAFFALVALRFLTVGNSLSDTAEYGVEGIQKLQELNSELEKQP
ncbi:MAG: hypothetical protein AAB439_01470 [Patescibacteria group bacterium]